MKKEVEDIVVEHRPADINIPFKRIYIAYIIFLIAQICLTISGASFGSNFKFLPKWLDLLAGFAIISYALYLIATMILFKVSKYSYYTLIIALLLLTALILEDICSTSESGLYQAWGRGIFWTIDFLEALFFGYFFQGTYLLLKQNGLDEGKKKLKTYLTIFLVIFILELIVHIFSKLPFVVNNILANRIFLYSDWVLVVLFYIYILVIAIICMFYIHRIKKKKEALENEKVF